nr:tetratricopeptide repeat protein [Methylomonas sp. SURF-2]
MATACDSPDELAENHLQKGKELLDKGEYDKAILELKTSAQSSDQRSETYYYMALLDEKSNNFKSMRENLKKTLELDPANIDARQKLGKVDLLFGDFDSALEHADFVLRANPGNEEAKLLRATVLIRQKKNEQASEIIDSVIAVNMKNTDALSLKAGLMFEENKLEQALELTERALQLDDKNIPLRLFRIKIHAKQNNSDAVVEDYKGLIELYPDVENFKLSLASIYSMKDQLQPAETLLREMIEKNKAKTEPKIILLEFLNAKAKDRVASEYQSMFDGWGENPSGRLELSKWMLASGYLDEAEKGLEKIVSVEKNNQTGLAAQAILAEIFIDKKQYDKADTAVSNILSENSDFVEANLLKARLFLINNKVDDAIELLNKVVWTKNDSDNAFMLLGQAYSTKKDPKQAEKNYKQALELNPANLQAFIPVYGKYLQANQKENARQLLEKALKAKPNQAMFLTYKAELDISEKRWDEAQETVQRIALFSKNKTIPVYFQANILQGKGQYADAVKLYEKILNEFPGHLNSLVNLIRSYDGLKQRDKSLAFVEGLHQKNKEDLTIVGVLSDLYMADKDYVKVKQLLENQIKLLPDKSVPLYLALAKVEAVLKKSADGAKQVYLAGLQANPDQPQLLLALGSLYEQLNDKNEARKVYEKIIEKTPDNILAVNNYAALLLESDQAEDLAKGLEMAQRFKDSENVSLQDTYAWGLVKNDKNPEGLALLESLIVKEPKMAELRYHLGVAHLKNGNKATALVELKQSIDLAEKQQRGFAGKDEAQRLIKELTGR